jgi:FkbM family methyltransferase
MLKNLLDNSGFNGLVKGRYGYHLYNKNDMYIGKSIGKYGEFSEGEATLFRQICQEGDIVLDVGANIGAHTLALSQFVGKTGRVYAFEPQPVVFQTLCANIALNSITNVNCYNVAVGERSGEVLMPDIDYSQQSNYGAVSADQFEIGQKISVHSLDAFLDVRRLKFIKIDVEGMEQDVINGARGLIHSFKPAIYLENDRRDKSKALIELMWGLDYDLYWHLPHIYSTDNFAGDNENLFEGVASCNMICLPAGIGHALTGFEKVTDSSNHPMAFLDNKQPSSATEF